MFEDPRSPATKARHSSQNNDIDFLGPPQKQEESSEDEEKDELDMYETDHKLLHDFSGNETSNALPFIGGIGQLKGKCDLVGEGNLMEVNAHRLLIKRKVLTGFSFLFSLFFCLLFSVFFGRARCLFEAFGKVG